MSFFSRLRDARRERREAAAHLARDAFWTWFRDNAPRFENYLENTHEVVAAIGQQIGAVDNQLNFELGRADDGIYEFIVSADGIRDVFPAVQALVAAAPVIPGWRVIAFRPRKSGDLANEVRYEGLSLGAGSLWYRATPNDDRLDLTLCVEGQDVTGVHSMLGAVFLLLDATLGEFDVATKIGALEFADCPDNPAADGFSRIPDLAGEVDRITATD